MRPALAMAAALISAAVAATPAATQEFYGRDAVNEWIDNYRHRPQPGRLPEAVQVLSRSMSFKDPESAAFYVGFIAGVLGANPKRAETLIARMLTLPPADHWVVVRAVAYSGLPGWRRLLRRFAARLPARRDMIEQYLSGRLPTLDAVAPDRSATFLEKVKAGFGRKPPAPPLSFAGNPELIDTLWGQYFATGAEAPVRRIVAVLPLSKETDDVARLTAGSLAKVTLANNASRYPDLLAMLKKLKSRQPDDTGQIIGEVIAAAETIDGPQLRKQALAAIEELRRKGPGTRRSVALWGQIGQGALALGCIAAAAASLTSLGLPCVVGGAVSSAALHYWTAQ
jgi:hypothetical protein